MAENASEHRGKSGPEAGPATGGRRATPRPLGPQRAPRRSRVPNFLSSIRLLLPAARLCVCVVCVCAGWGKRRCLSQDPSPLEKCKRVALTPASSPSAFARARCAPPQPRVPSLGCRAPCPLLWAPLGLQSGGLLPSLDGRPREPGRFLQGLDRSSGPSPFKLALLVPAAPRKASGLGDAEPRRGGAGAPPTDLAPRPGQGRVPGTYEPPRGANPGEELGPRPPSGPGTAPAPAATEPARAVGAARRAAAAWRRR